MIQGAKVIAVIAAAFAGALMVIGCLLAGVWEIQGFGTPRDTAPRLGHLVLYALGSAAGVAVPLVLWRILLPASAPATAVLAGITILVLVLSLLGLTIVR